MIDKNSNLIWIDLEMTGLNPMKDRIIEIALVVTDKDLNIIAEGEAMAIHQPTSVLEKMDDWNTEHHTDSGLWARVEDSHISTKDAERLSIEFLKEHIDIHRSPMCGNTICQDRRFLARWMPELENYFHYRQIDVSSIKELFRRWNPKILDGFEKKGNHLAMDDVKESIEELKYYRQFLGELNNIN